MRLLDDALGSTLHFATHLNRALTTLSAGILVTACGSAPPRPEPAPRPLEEVPARGEALSLPSGATFEEIAKLEELRSTGGGRLLELLVDEDSEVRVRAARATSRLPFPEFGDEITDALVRALEDEETQVRVEALFGLGLRADPRTAGVLAAYRNDPSPLVRARVIEAASRIDAPELHAELLVHLRDSALEVRIATVEATSRWSRDRADAQTVDRALIEALNPYALTEPTNASSSSALPMREVETELAWRILFSLARRGSPLGRGAFLEYATSTIPLERLFAMKGLGRLSVDDESDGGAEIVRVLSNALGDPNALGQPDWRVSYEAAVSLGKWQHADGLEPLLGAVEDENAHVRAAALTALANYSETPEQVQAVLRRGLLDVSTEVRIAALTSIAEVFPAGASLHMIERFAVSEDPILRAGAAQALGRVDTPDAVATIEKLVADPNLRVAGAAIAALGMSSPELARPTLLGLLEHEDNGLRLSAVSALQEMHQPEDVEPLLAAARSEGEMSSELMTTVLETLAQIGGAEARDAIYSAASDPRPEVRRVASRLLADHFHLNLPVAKTEPSADAVTETRPLPRHRFNPLVDVSTTRGTMVFELFPDETPVHVENFLELAQAGHYDGLIFHRVVPDFVIQGGDYRGDGNGNKPATGDFLRHEFTPRRYGRGALGMPRNQNVDSGGSQFFVTHRPTPHLDGRYTIFGELRAGGDVLDAIEVGDRILGVKLRR